MKSEITMRNSGQCGPRLHRTSSGRLLAGAAVAALLAGCNGGSTVNGSIVDSNGNIDGTDIGEVPVLKAEQADELIRNSMIGFYSDSANNNTRTDFIAFGGDVAVAESAADSATSADGGGSSSRFSDTNVQEAGVDEADRVKIDGNTLFALEKISQDFVGIFPLDVEIDVVSDQIFPAPRQTKETLSAYTLDTVNSSTLSRLELDTGSQTPEGMYLHKNGTARELVMLSRENFNNWAYWSYPRQWAGYKTRVSWFDASDASNIKKGRTMDFDGQLVSSRKINNRLILVTRYHPNLDGIIAYPFEETDIKRNRELIANADVADLLPGYELNVNGVTSSGTIVSDNRCYRAPVATADSSESDTSNADSSDTDAERLSIYYPSPTVMSIITIDLNSTGSNVQNTCFIGDTETMYVSQNALYLATTSYDYRINDDGNGRRIADYYEPEITTDIHKFSFNGNSAPVFKGSGSVKGHLGWYQERKPYRMSEKDNNLRVVTFDQSRDGSPVTLNILAESGGATLRTLSTLPNDNRPDPIGKTGENLYASRFIGDRAYLVTFRITDPLYVLDLANPSDPSIAGELELPGYSEYLHAVNEGLLVGLGKDAIAATNNGWGNGRGAWYQGVKLALFDVSNPAEPRVADSRVIGKRGTDSPALYAPHAFAYLSGNASVNPKLAFPLSLHNEAPQGSGPSAWSGWTSNNMATMEVDESANKFVDVPHWVFESREAGHTYSPVNLQNDRAIIGDDGGLYAIHNGSLFYGLWGEDAPSSNSE